MEWLKKITFNKTTVAVIGVSTFIIGLITFLFMVLMPHTVLKNDINITNIQENMKDIKEDVKNNYKKIEYVSMVSENTSRKLDNNSFKMDNLLVKITRIQRSLDKSGMVGITEKSAKKKCRPDDIKCLQSINEVCNK